MQENIEEVKEPIVGKFKPKRKFLNFVSAVSGARIRFIRDIAFLKGEKLSGVLEGVIFKVTICDEGTINFEEQEGTNLTDESMIKRLIDEIDSMDVTGYAQKFIVSGIEFSDIDGKLCYLEVEHQKPIDKLKSLFEEEEEEKRTELSERGFSILDALFSSESDEDLAREFEGESDEEWDEDHAQDLVLNSIVSDLSENDIEEIIKSNQSPPEPNEKLKTAAESYMEQQFRRMNEEKIMELEYRIEETQKEIIRYKNESKMAEKKAEEKMESLSVLETRLESMKPVDEPNGYVFFISEEIKDMESLDESEAKVAMKIADIMKLKGDVLIKMLTEGYYKIKIAKSDDVTNKDFELNKDIFEKIMRLDVDGKMKLVDDGFEYRGKLNWHQLVQKMIRSGFEQNEEFDKFCNSNSYESHEEVKETEMDSDTEEVKGSKEIITKRLMSYSEPSDFVILGCDYNGRDIEITDDFTNFDIKIDGEDKFCLESEGHVSIISIDKYKEWCEEFGDCDGVDAVLVSGYQGDINVGVKLEDGSYSTDFHFSDYINYQFEDDYPDVFINFPSGTQVNKIKNHDLNTVLTYLRDSKIKKVIN